MTANSPRQDTPPLATQTGVDIRVVHSLDEARDMWRELEADGDCYAFQSFAWLSAWYESVGRHGATQVCIVQIASADGRPLMLAPLAIERRRGAACLIWLGGVLTDYQAPILCDGFAARLGDLSFGQLWAAIVKRLPAHDAVLFQRQPQYINRQKNPFAELPVTPSASSAHAVHMNDDFETFLTTKRSARTLSTERRKRKNLSKLGELAFRVADSPTQIDRVLNVLTGQKSEHYRGLGVADLFASNHHCEFVSLLATRHLADGFVHVSSLELDDRIIATHWGLVYNNRFYYLLPGYEQRDLSKFSPGNILLQHLFEWCFDNGVAVCDFTVGDEPYKLHWRDSELKLFELMQANTLVGRACILPSVFRTRAKRALKRSPVLLDMIYDLRAHRAGFVRKLLARKGDR